MRIEILGCSGGVGPGLRTTSLLVDGITLLDAGTGVGDLSAEASRRIRRVLLTHAHLDHVCGLAFLADNLFGEIDEPVEVFARGETLGALRHHIFNWVVWPDFTRIPSAEHPGLVLRAMPPGAKLELGDGVVATSFEVCHTIPACGYVLSSPGGVFAFTGDTGRCAHLWDSLNALPRLDWLMIDVAFPNEEAELGELARHYTPALLRPELEALRHRPCLLLTHHKPGSEALIREQCASLLSDWSVRHVRRGDVFEV